MTLVLIFVVITVQAEDGILNKSILLAIFHALLSWIYVIYAAFFTKD